MEVFAFHLILLGSWHVFQGLEGAAFPSCIGGMCGLILLPFSVTIGLPSHRGVSRKQERKELTG
jgi:hypothetical protein